MRRAEVHLWLKHARFPEFNAIHSPGGWETLPIVLRFEERVSAPVREGVLKAASTWNNAIGFELLTFEGTADNFKGPLYDRLDDEISTVGVESYWCRTNKPNIVLGTTIVTTNSI